MGAELVCVDIEFAIGSTGRRKACRNTHATVQGALGFLVRGPDAAPPAGAEILN